MKDMKMKLNKRAMLTYILVTIGGFCFAGCNGNEQTKTGVATFEQTVS